MLHILAVLPLAAALATPAPGAVELDLAASLPVNTIAAVHITDPRALVASRETNNWVAFALDAQWDRYLSSFMQETGEELEVGEVSAWRQALLGAMSDSTGAMFFAAGDITISSTDPSFGLIVKGGDEASAYLRTFIGDDATEMSLGEGRNALLSEAGRAELYYEADGVIMLISAESQELSMEVAANVLGAMSGTIPQGRLGIGGGPDVKLKAPVGGPFGLPGVAKLSRPGVAIEAVINLESLWPRVMEDAESDVLTDFQLRALRDASSIAWAYASIELGVGEAMDGTYYMPYDEKGLIGDLFGFFGSADKSLLAAAPKGAISATAGAFDVGGFSTWVFDVMKDASEETHAQATGAVEMLKESMGIDLMNDVLGNMTGQFLWFQTPPDDASIDQLTALLNSGPMTLVAGVEDADPLLDIVEQLIDMSGLGASMESESLELAPERVMDIWRAGEELPLSGFIGVGDGKLLVSTDPTGGNAYLAKLGGNSDVGSILDDEKMAAAVAPLKGAIVSIQPTAGAADVLEGLGAMLEEFDVGGLEVIPNDNAGLVEDTEALKSLSHLFGGVADLFRQYFEGTTATEVHFEGGLVRMTFSVR